jgi:hypothetical protein
MALVLKNEGEALQEAAGTAVKKQNVTMGMQAFDCPVCSNPLRPPIFQVIARIQILSRFLCRSVHFNMFFLICVGVIILSSLGGFFAVHPWAFHLLAVSRQAPGQQMSDLF